MTEKEKMLAGLEYDANFDEELIAERLKCKDLLFRFNNTLPSDEVSRHKTLIEIFGEDYPEVSIESPFLCDYGYNIIFRGRAFINFGCKILDEAKVIFGENAFIGPGCGFYTACHPLDHSKRKKGIEWAKPITVGNNVWLGGDVTVLPGVTIGDNSVIGAGSVVTKDIPANCVAAGNPCKKIREI